MDLVEKIGFTGKLFVRVKEQTQGSDEQAWNLISDALEGLMMERQGVIDPAVSALRDGPQLQKALDSYSADDISAAVEALLERNGHLQQQSLFQAGTQELAPGLGGAGTEGAVSQGEELLRLRLTFPGGETVSADFAVSAGADQAERDSTMMAQLAQLGTYDYLSMGELEDGRTVYSGFFEVAGSERVQVDFESVPDQDMATLDALFLAGLGQQVKIEIEQRQPGQHLAPPDANEDLEYATPAGQSSRRPAKDRLLAALAVQDKQLAQALENVPEAAQEARKALEESRRHIQVLRNSVERDEARDTVRRAFTELEEAGVPVEEVKQELEALLADGKDAEQAERDEHGEHSEEMDSIGPADGAKGTIETSQRSQSRGAAKSEDTIGPANGKTDGKEKEGQGASGATHSSSPATLLDGKFVRDDAGNYRREGETEIALVDETTRIRFVDKQMDTFQASIELAATKGWSALEVTGSEKFRAEAWLHAKVAGFEVVGYEPTAKDKERLEARQAELSGRPAPHVVEGSRNAAEAVARTKGLKPKPANESKGRYEGKIVYETAHHVVQDVGLGEAAIHDRKNLAAAELGKAVSGKLSLSVAYSKDDQGRLVVHTKAREPRAQGLGR